MKITIGVQLAPGHGDYPRLRDACLEAEELGADCIFVWDHFFPLSLDPKAGRGAVHGKNFEAVSLQAAMAAITRRPQIGCLVHGNSYRNPNLLADIARTIDHISGGRFILGLGSGWCQLDYDEYGYQFGTAASRLRDLENNLPIIRARLAKLNPPPLHRIPILIGGVGEKVTLRLAAQHADIWHGFGDPATMKRKAEILDEWCAKVGRDPQMIIRSTSVVSSAGSKIGPDDYLSAGFTFFMTHSAGPEWNLQPLKDLLKWRGSTETLGCA